MDFKKKFIVEKTKENSEHQEVIIQRLRKKASSKIFEKIVGKTINNRITHMLFCDLSKILRVTSFTISV